MRLFSMITVPDNLTNKSEVKHVVLTEDEVVKIIKEDKDCVLTSRKLILDWFDGDNNYYLNDSIIVDIGIKE